MCNCINKYIFTCATELLCGVRTLRVFGLFASAGLRGKRFEEGRLGNVDRRALKINGWLMKFALNFWLRFGCHSGSIMGAFLMFKINENQLQIVSIR